MIIYNKIIPFGGYKLINLFGIIFAKKGAVLSDIDIRHEQIHTKLMLEMLVIPFYIWYIIEFLIRFICNGFYWKKAYRNISFEREAQDFEKDRYYLKTRLHYYWLKNLFNYARL